MSWGFWRPYVPVAQRRANARAHAMRLAKKEKRQLAPIELAGRAIATSFWGMAWCDNLEQYSDFANRLPRGRTYVRNGSVIDLQIERGKVKALVSGSSIYKVTISIKTVPQAAWSKIKKDCSHSVDSLLDLLQGRFDRGIMQRLTRCEDGLFPQPKEIDMSCSCPDWAGMCKHVAATLYGVGARLDAAPELLFALRDVDHLELINQAVDSDNLGQALKGKSSNTINSSDLGEIFGIELENDQAAVDEAGGHVTHRAHAQAKPVSSRVKAKRSFRDDVPGPVKTPSKRASKALSKKPVKKKKRKKLARG